MRHIEIVTCEHCGKVFEARAKNAKYCSRRCANQKGNAKRVRKEPLRCPHNQEVYCEKPQCDSCGWNPVVAEERLARLCGKREEAMA